MLGAGVEERVVVYKEEGTPKVKPDDGSVTFHNSGAHTEVLGRRGRTWQSLKSAGCRKDLLERVVASR